MPGPRPAALLQDREVQNGENRRVREDVGHPQAGHGLLREGGPVTVHPFTEV